MREVKEWAENTIKEKKELEEKKKAKQEKAQEKLDLQEVERLQSTLVKMSGIGVKSERKVSSKGDDDNREGSRAESMKPEPSHSESASRVQSPDSARESDSDSCMITEPTQHQEPNVSQ